MTSTTGTRLPNPDFVHPELTAPETGEGRAARYVASVTRLSLSTIFVWAFIDKLFGLGHATKAGKGWLDGGSPTTGFLKGAAAGPLKGFYNNLAGVAVIDWLFMGALLGVGVALLLGVAMRPAAIAGGLLMVMMWSAVLPPSNHIFMDDHIIYALVLVGLALTYAGRTLGLGRQWESLPLVRRFPVLK
jgi:thiosulfate dehydrogenase (quinone) large subunit